ncbi:MAG: S53 family peptidase [Planctomycetes bacterium]|nr:S53 family peptidase [Planctomycetota bacterium]
MRRRAIVRSYRAMVESLDGRCLMSATDELLLLGAATTDTTTSDTVDVAADDGPQATPNLEILADAATDTTSNASSALPPGYSPAQIISAYGFGNITFAGGIKGTGAGQTIAIVDAYSNPNIVADLAAFDKMYNLAAPPKFSVVNQNGGSLLPVGNRSWAIEIALDVEWAHAIAPAANILLVEASSASLTNLMAAVNYARSAAGVSVVSMSWGASEFSTEKSYDSYFVTPAGHNPVTFVVSSGDSGAPAQYPSSSPNVLSVGGTTLSANTAGTYIGETSWAGSGGGPSRYETRPSYQNGESQSGFYRGTPDVSYDANPLTGVAMYDTYGGAGWFRVGGTSAGAPQWAALVAIADQGRVLAGKATLGNAQTAIYSLSSADFHDVTTGYNGYFAGSGYDLVTGRGSPIANAVVRDLVAFGGSTSFTQGSVPTNSLLSLLSLLLGSLRGILKFDEPSSINAMVELVSAGDAANGAIDLPDDSFAGVGASVGGFDATPHFLTTSDDASNTRASFTPAIAAALLASRGEFVSAGLASVNETFADVDAMFAQLGRANGGRFAGLRATSLL